MKNKTRAVYNDFESLAKDAQDLLAATADVAEVKVSDARKRLSGALDRCKETWDTVQDSAVNGAKVTDTTIRENPYQAIGVALGVGALVGFLLARRP